VKHQSTEEAISGLHSQHVSLDRLAVSATKALQARSMDELIPIWAELEAHVRRHLAAEETSLLPDYLKYDPVTAQQIELEHDDLRRRLRACRLSLIDGTAKDEELHAALNAYRAHQLHEDTTVYRWASER
jgi:Hemerythrin HHE cation binding domain